MTYEISDIDARLGAEGYVKYVAGIAVLNNPNSEIAKSIHCRQVSAGSLKPIVSCAEKLMIAGSRQIIRHANSPDKRSSDVSMREAYEEALPNMLDIVEGSMVSQRDRIVSLNPAFSIIRPAAFIEEGVYKDLCGENSSAASVANLMGGFAVASNLEYLALGDRQG